MKYMQLFVLFLATSILAEDAPKEGKVFVKSEPAGADIYFLYFDDKGVEVQKDIKKKTSSLLQLPVGKFELLLKLEGYADARLPIKVDGTAILKPDTVKLEVATAKADIVFSEEGWSVYIDKQPAKDVAGKPAMTPCTIAFPATAKEVSIAKDGFKEIIQKIADGKIKPFEGKPVKGENKVVAAKPAVTKLVIWNNTDGQGDHGAEQVKVEFFKAGTAVWNKIIDANWKEGEDSKTEVEVPWPAGIEKIKVTVTRQHKFDAGIAEVELLVGDQNILKNKKVTASSEWDQTGRSTVPSKVTDGEHNGGWRARGRAGWVEIEVESK